MMPKEQSLEATIDSLGVTANRIADERNEFKRQRDALLAAAKRLTTEVIIGYENEQQATWPANVKVHQCPTCYNSAKKLRQAISDCEKA